MSDGQTHDGSNPKLKALAEGMRTVAEAGGVPVPEEVAGDCLTLWLNEPVQHMAPKVADWLRSGRFQLYRRGTQIGTIDEGTGEWREMDEHRFCTWLPGQACVKLVSRWDKAGNIEEGEMDITTAKKILRCDAMRVLLPEVERIHPIKMPVMRAELDERDDPKRKGFRKIELLNQGYDAASKTFTIRGGLDYREDATEDEAVSWFHRLLAHFEWGAGGGAGVHMAAQFSVFASLLFPGKAPMFLWNANMPGSGKSRLGKLALWAVYGEASAAMSDIEQRDKFREELNSRAQFFEPYVFFDDVDLGGKVFRSSDLNRWLTNDTWACRVLGGSGWFKGPLYAVTLITANRLKLSEDLQRRTLICDIFSHFKSDDRVLPPDTIILDDEFFREESNREKVLSYLWSVIKAWDDAGRPGVPEKSLASFEGWSRVVPSLVDRCMLASPLTKFDAPDTGNAAGREFEQLIKLVIRKYGDRQKTVRVSLSQIVGVARLNKMFSDPWPKGVGSIEDVLASAGERGGFKAEFKKQEPGEVLDAEVPAADKNEQAVEWVNPSIRSSWGKRLKRDFGDGRYFRDERGDVWAFGDRESTDAASYLLQLARTS